MNPKTNLTPISELVIPALESLLAKNQAAREKRLRKLAALHQAHRGNK